MDKFNLELHLIKEKNKVRENWCEQRVVARGGLLASTSALSTTSTSMPTRMERNAAWPECVGEGPSKAVEGSAMGVSPHPTVRNNGAA